MRILIALAKQTQLWSAEGRTLDYMEANPSNSIFYYYLIAILGNKMSWEKKDPEVEN